MTGASGPDPADDWRLAVRARLLERRVVVVAGRLDGAAAGEAAMALAALDGSGDGPVDLRLDCPDGDLEAALSLMDVVELTGVTVRVTCVGSAGGPAVGVVAVGHRRAAMPHSRFHLDAPRAARAGTATDLARWADEQAARWDLYRRRVAAACGGAPGPVLEALDAGRYLDAEQALALGLVDEVLRPDAAVHRLPGRPVGFHPG